MTTETDSDAAEENSIDPNYARSEGDEWTHNPMAGLTVGGHRVTDTLIGIRNENHDGVVRGAYPDGLDPGDFVGTLRRFVSKSVQYIYVVGDLDGHAVYRMLNEGEPGSRLYSLPWDRFIDETARVNPDAVSTPDDDPARTVVRTDFDTLRRRRETEIETGCTCLDNEACDHCGGQKEGQA